MPEMTEADDREKSFTDLVQHVTERSPESAEGVDLGRDLLIICPDCDRQVAFRGKCPKCGGASWIEAGHWATLEAVGRAARVQRERRRAATRRLEQLRIVAHWERGTIK